MEKFLGKNNYLILIIKFVIIINLIFFQKEIYLYFDSYACHQCVDYNQFKDNFLKQIFFFHAQPVGWPLLLKLLEAILSFFNYPLLFDGIVNSNLNNVPIPLQSVAHILLVINFFLLSLTWFLFFKIICKYLSKKYSLIITLILCASPLSLYYVQFATWHIFNILFLMLILYCYFYYENINNKKKCIYISIICILLWIIRSSNTALIIFSIIVFFGLKTENLRNFFKLSAPFAIIFILICGKNLILFKSFSSETQSIYHFSHSWGSFVTKNKDFYENLSDTQKKIVRHYNTGLLNGSGSYDTIGYKNHHKKYNHLLTGGNSISLLLANSDYKKILINTLKEKSIVEYLQYFYISYNYGFSVNNLVEGNEIFQRSFFFKYYYILRDNLFNYGLVFLFLLITSSLIRFENIFKFRNMSINEKNFFFLDLLAWYYVLITSVLVINGNSRYNLIHEPIFLIFIIINSIYLFKKIFQKDKRTIYTSLIVLTVLAALNPLRLTLNHKTNFNFFDSKPANYINVLNNYHSSNFDLISSYKNINLPLINNEIIEEYKLIKIPFQNVKIGSDWYFAKKQTKWVDPFYVQKNELSLKNYLKFLNYNNYSKNLPIWWNKNLNIDENLNLYKKIYNISDKKFLTENYPITGINFYDASDYINWLNKKHDSLNFNLISGDQWDSLYNYLAKNKKLKKPINGINALTKDKFDHLINMATCPSDKVCDLYGNLWEWTINPSNIIYTLGTNGYRLNVDPKDYNNNKVYKKKDENSTFLRGGSYYHSSSWGYFIPTKLIIGKSIADKDFGFRIVVTPKI